MGFSDEDGNSSDLQTDDPGDSDEGIIEHYPSFTMPKKFIGFKWTLGCKFSSKEEFKEAVINYSVCNGYDLRFIKDDKERVRVGCKDRCPWIALCSKIPGEDTWQLRKLVDEHNFSSEYTLKFMTAGWLGNKLLSTVRENPKISTTKIINKVHEKWNIGISRMTTYRLGRKQLKKLMDVLGSSTEGYITMDMRYLDQIQRVLSKFKCNILSNMKNQQKKDT